MHQIVQRLYSSQTPLVELSLTALDPPDPVVGEGRGGLMEGRGEKRRKEGRTLPPLNLSLAMPLYKTLKVMNVRTIT